MIVNHKSQIYEFEYPHAEKINPILHKTIEQNLSIEDRGTKQTEWYFKSKEFDLISDYVIHKIYSEDLFAVVEVPGEYVLLTRWGMWYDRGQYQNIHDHLPCHYSFVYFVNTPKGSSSLVFSDSGKKVIPKSGHGVIFPAFLNHHIPSNNCQGRTSVVGNFYYKVR